MAHKDAREDNEDLHVQDEQAATKKKDKKSKTDKAARKAAKQKKEQEQGAGGEDHDGHSSAKARKEKKRKAKSERALADAGGERVGEQGDTEVQVDPMVSSGNEKKEKSRHKRQRKQFREEVSSEGDVQWDEGPSGAGTGAPSTDADAAENNDGGDHVTKRLASSSNIKCRRCGDYGHVSTDCPMTKNRAFWEKRTKVQCYVCREQGHMASECPQNPGGSVRRQARTVLERKKQTMCYNCGRTGHRLWNCPKPKDGDGFAFATCFVCKGKGHLASQCPQNENGIYPDGGACRYCQSKFHLAKDCTKRKRNFKPRDSRREDATEPKRPAPKVVSF